jgi:4-hydroxy-3-methylbut-2-enyl diphosphate reductase
MKVLKATAMGMCFGVKDALQAVHRLDRPWEVTLYGELVHNPQVLQDLKACGVKALGEEDRSPALAGERVVVTAHGISHRERQVLMDAGKSLIDTTCPLVRRTHELALRFHELGYYVVLVGRHGHVEVKGLTGDLKNFAVVEAPEEVRDFPTDRIAILCQTTTPPDHLERMYLRIVRRNFGKEIRFADTICRPTRERQEAVLDLIPRVQALVVVGGRHSNNTQQLATLGRRRGLPVICVERAGELDPSWFQGFTTVGLTAGTSTLEGTIEEVERVLCAMEVQHVAIRK